MPREPSAAAEAIAGDAIRILYRRCIADVRRLYRLYRGPLEREGKWETSPAAATSVRYVPSLKERAPFWVRSYNQLMRA